MIKFTELLMVSVQICSMIKLLWVTDGSGSEICKSDREYRESTDVWLSFSGS